MDFKNKLKQFAEDLRKEFEAQKNTKLPWVMLVAGFLSGKIL